LPCGSSMPSSARSLKLSHSLWDKCPGAMCAPCWPR
jgi:hypothetical protein